MQPVLRIDRKKHHAHAVLAGRGQGETQARRFALEERVRNLDQDARAIAGLRIAPAGAAMGQIDQNLHAFENDVVRLPAFDVGDEADAASVVLVLRAVKSLSRRQCLEMDIVPSCEPGSTSWGVINLAMTPRPPCQASPTLSLLLNRAGQIAPCNASRQPDTGSGASYTSTPSPNRLSGKCLSYHCLRPIVPTAMGIPICDPSHYFFEFIAGWPSRFCYNSALKLWISTNSPLSLKLPNWAAFRAPARNCSARSRPSARRCANSSRNTAKSFSTAGASPCG